MKSSTSIFWKSIFIACLPLSFIACGSSSSDKKVTDDEPAAQQNNYSLTYTDIMEFTRGVESKYDIKGSFPNDPTPKITIDALPSGATFAEGILSWTPSCDLSPADGLFIHGYMNVNIRINFSSDKTDSLVQKPAILLVHQTGPDSTCKD